MPNGDGFGCEHGPLWEQVKHLQEERDEYQRLYTDERSKRNRAEADLEHLKRIFSIAPQVELQERREKKEGAGR